MSETSDERITRLLAEGLDSYGIGDVGKAILTWEEVLALDPDNTDARDYIRTADRRKRPRPPKEPDASPALRAIASEARQLIERGGHEQAFELLRTASEGQPGSLEIQANFDLVRSRLLGQYRADVGALDGIARVANSGADITKFNLPPGAGFLLSMIDGQTSIADLISLSGMDDFEALHLLRGLREAGIVELGT